jgi:hypothetical protein
MAGGGQDRAPALGWGEGFHPNRPKTVAHNPSIPQTSYKCSKHRKATIAYNFTTLRSGPDEPAKLVEEVSWSARHYPLDGGYADFREGDLHAVP